MPAREVTLANRHRRLRLDRHAVTAAIAELDAHADKFRGGCPPGELSLVFLSDAALAELHGTFLDDPTVTDVITFEGNPALGSAGEVCVSADAATRQVARRSSSRTRKRFAASSRRAASFPPKSHDFGYSDEVLLYVVHGWLHLAGYDDLQPAKKREMRRAEARAMKLLAPLRARLPFRLLK
jgi:probable rRNA maturation factor